MGKNGKTSLLNSGKPPRAKAKPAKGRIENLTPWKPGQSGNPDGRPPNIGATVKEWWNLLQHATLRELKAIAEDEDAPQAKAMAAVEMVHARSLDRTASGQPINGPSVDRIIENTDGKPKQAMDVTSNGQTVKQFVNVNVDAV